MGFSGVLRRDLQWHRAKVSELSLADQHIAIVGGTGGLGRAIARALASRGAKVTVVGQTFRDQGVARIDFLQADLSLMSEAKRVARELPAEQLDLVLLTTGILAAPERQVTPEGLERDMAVSYLSRLQILRDLAPRLGTQRQDRTSKPRVFVMGFPGTDQKAALDDLNAEKSYGAMAVHMQTVAGNEALVLDSARRYPQINFYGLNPGLIKTDIRSNFFGKGSIRHRLVESMIGLLMISPETYAERIAPLLVSADLEPHSGSMFNQKGAAIHASKTLTAPYVVDLISASEKLLEQRAVH